MRATLEFIEDIGKNIKTFWFKPERPLRYVAGQYLDIRVVHEDADSRGMVRTISLSSSPSEQPVCITTTIEPHGGSSFKRALLALKPGDHVTMTDPMGDFILPKNPGVPVTFVAGGIGIAPVRSMVKWLIDSGEARDVHIIYIGRSPESMPFVSLLQSYPHAQLALIYTQQAPNDGQISARPSTTELLRLIGDNERLIYLSGPKPMMETYWYELQASGVPRDQLVLDYFTGYVEL